jgi:hypothetical protein
MDVRGEPITVGRIVQLTQENNELLARVRENQLAVDGLKYATQTIEKYKQQYIAAVDLATKYCQMAEQAIKERDIAEAKCACLEKLLKEVRR